MWVRLSWTHLFTPTREGVPDWLTPVSLVPFPLPVTETPYELDENGYPNLTQCLQYNFADYYFSYQVENAFQCLYDNYNGMQDEFAAFWNVLSQTFKDSEGVLGYELINEPVRLNFFHSNSYLTVAWQLFH